MKTVVQQIIEKFEHIQKNDCKTLPEHIFFDGVLAILESVYLDIEKNQIIEAYNSGWQYGFLANGSELQPTKNSETYFAETYTTNKETLK